MEGTQTQPTRYALIWGMADRLETIKRYLPSNYAARTINANVLVSGHDSAGWTLEDYVIPRLASGLFTARDVGSSWPAAWGVEGPDPSVGIFGDLVWHEGCPVADTHLVTHEEHVLGTRVADGLEWVAVLHLLTCEVCSEQAAFVEEQFGGPVEDYQPEPEATHACWVDDTLCPECGAGPA